MVAVRRRLVVAAAVMAALAVARLGLAAGPAAGQTAPELRGALHDGKPYDLSAQRGSVVLVDFWATWCEPCKVSLPRYAALERKLGAQGFHVVAVSVDEDAAALRRFVAATKLELRVVHDPAGKIADRYQPAKMPTAYLVGRDGKISWIHGSFAAGDEAKVEAEVRKALAVSP